MLSIKSRNLLSVVALAGYWIFTSSIPTVGAAPRCALNKKGLIGVDSGSAIFVACEYEITVAEGTPRSKVAKSLVPALDSALVRRLAPKVISDCAPLNADTSEFADIVGLDTEPMDKILQKKCVQPSPDCYRIHFETIVYVKDSTENVESTVWLAFRTVSNGNFANLDPSIKGLKVTKNSWVDPLDPRAADQVKHETKKNLRDFLRSKGVQDWKAKTKAFFVSIYNNKALFWSLVGLVAAIVLGIVSYVIWWAATKEKGVKCCDPQKGCCYPCNRCRISCTTKLKACWDKCCGNCCKK